MKLWSRCHANITHLFSECSGMHSNFIKCPERLPEFALITRCCSLLSPFAYQGNAAWKKPNSTSTQENTTLRKLLLAETCKHTGQRGLFISAEACPCLSSSSPLFTACAVFFFFGDAWFCCLTLNATIYKYCVSQPDGDQVDRDSKAGDKRRRRAADPAG